MSVEFDAFRWKIMVSVNPSPTKEGKRYYAELSKVSPSGAVYGTKYYKYYLSPEEAFEQMYIFAIREGIVLTEKQLNEYGFFKDYVDPSRIEGKEE